MAQDKARTVTSAPNPDADDCKETKSGPIPRDWDLLPFEASILDKRADVGKVNQADFRQYGKYPVVDQGQTFIAGYDDDEELVYRGDLPVVLFGDHTRIFKLVSFPFICGADGVKVLQPDPRRYDAEFFYYACTNLQIPSKGYSRHYKALKEQFVPLPPLAEQRRIAAVLNAIQDAIAAQEDVIAAARAFKRSLMHRLFTYGPGPVPAATKETEIGEIPEHWELDTLKSLASISTGTTPSTTRQEYYVGYHSFIKTAEIVNNRIRSAASHVSDEAIADYNLKLYPPGTVLMAMYGQGKTRGQVALLEIAASTTQNAAAIVPKKRLDSEYLWQYFLGRYEMLRGAGIEGHISHLNLGYVGGLMIPIAPMEEQKQLSGSLAVADVKIAAEEDRKTALEALFKSMLHELMTGRLRLLRDDGLPGLAARLRVAE